MFKIIAISGPTASGKSELGIKLAFQFAGEIISADSIQVYKHLNIGSAKPTKADQQKTPHHLLDILNPNQTYDAGQFVQHAKQAVASVIQKNKLPILLGGTGLYLRSLLHGLIQAPKINVQDIQKIANLSLTEAWAELQRLDPSSANVLHKNDQQRIRRALAFFLTTQQSITQHQQQHNLQPANYSYLMLAINWPRNVLYARINQRVLDMLQQGLLGEVKQLLDKNYQAGLSCLQSIGYKQAVAHLQGQLSYQEMVDQTQLQTRRYAKRQLTWLRHQAKVHWLNPENCMDEATKLVQGFLIG